MAQETGAFGLAGWSGQSRGMAAAHRHLDMEINYVLAGKMTYLVGGRVIEAPLRHLCLIWGGVPHQMIRAPFAVEAIWVTIPLTIALRWGLPERLMRPLLANGFVADAAPRPGDLDLLRQWLDDLPDHDALRPVTAGTGTAATEIVLLEIEARLRRFALGLSRLSPEKTETQRGSAAIPDHGLAAVESMAQFICGNFREVIGAAEIAGAAHLHPNYAMTLFRKHTGMTLSQYLILQRVAHAQQRLLTSNEPIQAIAFGSGFGSVSRFYEAFQQQTGNSPRHFRLHGAPSPSRRA